MPRAVTTDPAVADLELVGLKAGRTIDKPVELLAQLDSAVGWKAASTHPLQPLETEYQGIVRNATRDIRDIELRKQVESELLGRFFFLNAAPPRLLGVREGETHQGVELPLPQDRLRESRAQLLAAKRMMTAGGEIDGGALRGHVRNAWGLAESVRQAFLGLPDSVHWPVPTIQKAGLALNGLPGLPGLIDTTADLKVMKAIYALIGKAVSQLDKAVAGLASVQMLYMIESFYLFRLLVRYRVRSSEALTPDAINEASATLTGLVTNGHPRLARWLSAKIVDLGNRVTGIDPDNVLFFLKGGRALQCLYGPATDGQNDWDSQIVLNPNLPPREWYELFRQVSNEVLLALGDYKREFYMLLHLYAADFRQELPDTPEPMDIDDPDGPTIVDWMDVEDWVEPMEVDPAPPAPKLEANCKAELIDVGLPRYDTVEAREQWAHLRGRILRQDGVPFPWPLYFIDEYLLMVREVLSGLSPALRKAPKRLERLHDVLSLDSAREAVQVQYQEIPASLHGARAAIGTLLSRDAEYVLFVLLRQFASAYGVDKDPGFAAAFNTWFAREVERLRDYGRYPSDLRGRIAELGGARAWTDDIAHLILAIGFGEYVSEAMEAHFRARAQFMASQQAVLGGFVRDLYRNSIFSPEEELELQMALRGSYGAREQALYARSPQAGELDPVTYVSIGLYSPTENADAAAILDLVQNAVNAALPPSLGAVRDDAAGAIRLYWTTPQSIAPLAPYNPLAAEIVVEPAPRRPLLSYIWGLPVLGMGDLLRDYREQAGRTEEFGRQLILRRTAGALVEMISAAANPEPQPSEGMG